MNLSYSRIIGILLTLGVCCVERDNPLDERGGQYMAPEVYVQESLSSIPRDDTIHFDTGSIVLTGNRDESRFQVTLDGAESDEWNSAGIFSFTDMHDGRHVLRITSRYAGGSRDTTDSVVFFVRVAGYKPSFLLASDTMLLVETGTRVTLIPGVTGADTLLLQWWKTDTLLVGADSSTLFFPAITEADSGAYFCTAENRFGKAISNRFTINVHTPKPPVRNKIHYYANGADSGSVPIDSNLYVENELITLKGNTGLLFRNNYTFAGWAPASTDSVNVFSAGSTITMHTSEITMYAVWTKQPLYRITYDPNGARSGKPPVDNTLYRKGAAITVLDNTGDLEMIDSVFIGWSRSRGDTTAVYRAADTLIIGTSDTLFAHWKGKPRFYIAYNENGADNGTVPKDENGYIAGTIAYVKGNPNVLAKAGFTFIGWGTDTSGRTGRYVGGDTIIIGTSSITLYALWSSNPTFTVAYEKNNADTGEVPTDNNHYETGFPVTIKGNNGNLRRLGYTFIGWSRMQDGTGGIFKSGDLLEMGNKNLTLYAVWTSNPTFTVTYLPNGATQGEPPIDASNYEAGSTVTLPGNGNLAKTGFSFVGWNSEREGSGTLFLKDSTFTMGNGNDTLFAQWRINSYEIRFDSRGGSAVTSQTVSYGDTIVQPLVPERPTYDFGGWFIDSACVNRWTFTTTINTSRTLYARWIHKSYNVTFITLGGDSIAPQTVFHGDKAALPAPAPTRMNHTFGGWYREAAATNAWDFASAITAPLTLFAKWTIDSHTVGFVTYGGSAVASQSIAHGGKVTQPPEPLLTNYNFNGWYREASSITVWNFSTDTVTAAMSLHAKWTIKNYPVTFDTRGGSVVSSISVNHGDTIRRPTDPTKSGNIFAGWYADSSFTSVWQFGTGAVTAARTLYARWEIQGVFRVFLCFGQSNMSGGGGVQPGAEDMQTHPRVKVYAFANCNNPARTANQWADAVEPMHCGDGVNTMGPSYAFGRTLADSLPNDTIGLIPCGQWGVAIEYFMKGGTYTGSKPNYPGGNNVYEWMLARCSGAQTRGVFSGIILHQGESNAGQSDWPTKVKSIYDNLKNDLPFVDVPIVAGELLYSGCCPSHNAYVRQLPSVIPGYGYYASADGLPGADQYHFNQAGYRELGRRFAVEMLKGIREHPNP